MAWEWDGWCVGGGAGFGGLPWLGAGPPNAAMAWGKGGDPWASGYEEWGGCQGKGASSSWPPGGPDAGDNWGVRNDQGDGNSGLRSFGSVPVFSCAGGGPRKSFLDFDAKGSNLASSRDIFLSGVAGGGGEGGEVGDGRGGVRGQEGKDRKNVRKSRSRSRSRKKEKKGKKRSASRSRKRKRRRQSSRSSSDKDDGNGNDNNNVEDDEEQERIKKIQNAARINRIKKRREAARKAGDDVMVVSETSVSVTQAAPATAHRGRPAEPKEQAAAAAAAVRPSLDLAAATSTNTVLDDQALLLQALDAALSQGGDAPIVGATTTTTSPKSPAGSPTTSAPAPSRSQASVVDIDDD